MFKKLGLKGSNKDSNRLKKGSDKKELTEFLAERSK